MTDDADLVSEAVVVWSGEGRSSWPLREGAAIVERFGADQARWLVPAVRALSEDFYSSDTHHWVVDLIDMGKAAAAAFRQRHPAVSEEAVAALTWCYTFDFK